MNSDQIHLLAQYAYCLRQPILLGYALQSSVRISQAWSRHIQQNNVAECEVLDCTTSDNS